MTLTGLDRQLLACIPSDAERPLPQILRAHGRRHGYTLTYSKHLACLLSLVDRGYLAQRVEGRRKYFKREVPA